MPCESRKTEALSDLRRNFSRRPVYINDQRVQRHLETAELVVQDRLAGRVAPPPSNSLPDQRLVAPETDEVDAVTNRELVAVPLGKSRGYKNSILGPSQQVVDFGPQRVEPRSAVGVC